MEASAFNVLELLVALLVVAIMFAPNVILVTNLILSPMNAQSVLILARPVYLPLLRTMLANVQLAPSLTPVRPTQMENALLALSLIAFNALQMPFLLVLSVQLAIKLIIITALLLKDNACLSAQTQPALHA